MPNDKHSNAKCQQHCHQALPPPGIKLNSIQHCHQASNLIQHCRVKSALPDWTPTPKASPLCQHSPTDLSLVRAPDSVAMVASGNPWLRCMWSVSGSCSTQQHTSAASSERMGKGSVATRSGFDTDLSGTNNQTQRCQVARAIKKTSMWLFDLLLLCGYLLPTNRSAAWTASLMVARSILYLAQFLLVLGLVQAVQEQDNDDKSALVKIIDHLVGVSGDSMPSPERLKQEISFTGLGDLNLPQTMKNSHDKTTTTWQQNATIATTTGPAVFTTTTRPAVLTTTTGPAVFTTTTGPAIWTTTTNVTDFAEFPWMSLLGSSVVLTLAACICGGASWATVSQIRRRISNHQCEMP